MNTFVYDSSPLNINTFTTQDFGSIGDAPTVTADYEIARDDIVVAEGQDLIVENDLILFVESTADYDEINFTETTYPFGKITVGGGESASATVVFISAPEPIRLYEKAIVVRKQAWTGSGTLFEISNGLERIAAPYIGGSGPLRVSGSATVLRSPAHNEFSFKAYGTADYGNLGVVGSSVDLGQVNQEFTTESEYGSIVVGDEVRASGSFRWSSNTVTKLEKDWTKVGSGSLFGLSGAGVVVAQTDETTGLFNVFNSTIPDAFSRIYNGSGSLFTIFTNAESRTFIYNSEAVLSLDVDQIDYGVGLGTVSVTEDYGPVGGNSTGDTDYGQIAIGDLVPYGTFRFSGGIDEDFRPVLRTFGHQSIGGFNVSGSSTDQLNEPATQIYVVTGNEVDIRTKHVFTLTGGDNNILSRGYHGSGSLFNIGNRIEKAVFSYNIDPIVTGSIAPVTVLANDTQYIDTSSFDDVRVVSSGTGTGSTGGFNIGTHLAFGYVNPADTTADGNNRYFDLNPIDATSLTSITFSAIKGSGSNGGETPDIGENLVLHYSVDGGSTFNPIGISSAIIVDYTDATFNTLKDVTLSIPSLARTTSTIFRVLQEGSSGYQYDHYGITQFVLNDVSTIVSVSGQTYGSSTSIDNGNIGTTPTTTSDYGQVAGQSGGDTDYGALIFADATKFGTLHVSGAAVTAPDALNLGIYVASIEDQDWSVDGKIRRDALFFGGAVTQTAVFSEVGSGSLFSVVGGIETATFSYTSESITPLSDPISYGSIGTSPTANIDHGIVGGNTVGDQDYGETVPITTLVPFGTLNAAGSGLDRAIHSVVGEGSLFTAGGLVESKSNTEAESTVLFTFDGTAAEKQTDSYVGTGSLFHVGDRLERASYSYNESAILEIATENDYGSITSTGTSVDYGSVGTSYTAETDNGLIIDYERVEPYGLFRISGAAATVAYQRFPWTGNAFLRFTHQPLPTDTRFVPAYAGSGEFALEWNNSEAYCKATYIGQGRLFSIGDKVERNTYSYNTSSIVSLGSDIDYGSIDSTPSATLDYGTSTGISSSGDDYGNISTLPGEERPLGQLFDLVGAAEYVFKPIFAWNRQSPPIKVFNDQQDPADFRFRPHWRSRHLLGTPTIRNAPDGEFNTYARTRPFIGEGSLFSIGDKEERATYRYSSTSTVTFEPTEDYGSITSSPTATADYGSVDQVVTGGEGDLGSIVIDDNLQPLTGLFRISGAAPKVQFIRGPYVVKPTVIRIFNEQQDPADFRFRPHWRSRPYEQGKLTGEAATPRARDFVGSGSLFHIGDKVERNTYSYNTSSVYEYSEIGDYGDLGAVTSSEDYGSVGATNTAEQDYGNLTTTDWVYPFGLFAVSGSAITKEINVYGYYGDDNDPGTSGSLFAFKGAAESITSNPPENTVLYTFGSGYSALSFSKGNYDGSGSLFNIGDRIERAAYSYNTSSSIDDVTAEGDYGSITNAAGTTVDYGSVDSASVPPYVDQGDLITVPGEGEPFGLFKISGAASDVQAVASWLGTGSLTTFDGAAEAAVWQTPEETFLFEFTGGAVEKHVENYVGSGLIKIKEETPLAPNAAVRFRPWWRSYGEINVYGEADELFKGAYIGNKSNVSLHIETPNPGQEWRSYRPSPRYVNSIYGKIGGSAFVNGDGATRKINVYGYYGDDRDPGTSGSLFGFGGGAESRSIALETDESVTLFTASGTAASKFNPHWRGRPDGSPRLSGTPDLVLRFNIFTNPEFEKFVFSGTPDLKITFSQIGSGSLFSVGGASEVVGFNPTTETALFTWHGNTIVGFSLLHIGEGTFSTIGGAAESTTVEVPDSTVLFIPSGSAGQATTRDFIGEGSTSLSGNLVESQTDVYVGEGSLFSAGGGAEAVSVIEAESTVLFTAAGGEDYSLTRSAVAEGATNIYGIADEGFARPFIGEGSLFSIGGASESATVAEESTGLFTFEGNSVLEISKSFSGSGSIFGIGGAAEAVAVVPEIKSETNLYRFSGIAAEKQSSKYISEGVTAFVSGSADVVAARIYEGEGSLFTVGGATESTTSNPPENTVLYTVEGRGAFKVTSDYVGSGTEFVSGAGDVTRSRDFVGSGSLFSTNGAAESTTVVVESIQLFSASGTAAESFTKGNYDGSGSTTVSGEVSDIKLTYGNQVFAYVSTSGELDERQTDAYVGSGSLFGYNGVAESRTIDIDTVEESASGEDVSTNLFTVTGNNPGSVTRITQPGTAKFKVTGSSVNVLILFSPIRIFSTII